MVLLNEPVNEYACAFSSVRCAKNIIWWLIALMIVLQLGSFVMVEFVGVVDPLYKSAATASSGPATASQPAGIDQANMWHDAFQWVLPTSKFLAMMLAILLLLVLLLAVQISLIGRLGGAAGLVAALLWSLVLLALLMPWQQLFRGSLFCGATFNLGDLVSYAKTAKADWAGHPVNMFDVVAYYLRFIGYPVVVVLVWLLVQFKFACGVRAMNLPKSTAASPSA